MPRRMEGVILEAIPQARLELQLLVECADTIVVKIKTSYSVVGAVRSVVITPIPRLNQECRTSDQMFPSACPTNHKVRFDHSLL